MAGPQEVWNALTDRAFTKRYWHGTEVRSDWQIGSTVDLADPAGNVATTGKVLACDPPRLLSYTWTVSFHEVFSCEGASKVTFELTPAGNATQLTVTHEGFPPDSIVLDAISGGWPSVISGLKTILETGVLEFPIGGEPGKDPYAEAIAWGIAERERRTKK
jgi:uncharacterized protein YndB with AHSA1/START domain